MNTTKKTLLPILLAAFVDMFGIGIIIPIIPTLFLGQTSIFFEQFPDAYKTILLGALVGMYPLAQFFGAPILGLLSDKFGRRPILIFSLLGTVIGYILFAVGILLGHVWLLFLGRILDGFTGGNISTVYSAVADISKDKEKAKHFGYIGMAFGLGFVLGPFFGAKLADPTVVSWFNIDTPFWFGAILAFTNMLLVIKLFPETLKNKLNTKLDFFIGFRNIYKAFEFKNLRTIFFVMFLLSLGFNLFVQFFAVFLVKKFGITQSQVGDFFAYVGIWIALAQGLVTRAISKRFSPEKVLPVAILGLCLALFSIAFIKSYSHMFLIVPFVAIFQGLILPNATAILSNLSDEKSQGEVMGISQSLTALSQVVPPFIDGVIININVNFPVMFASFVTFGGFVAFKTLYRKASLKS
jgi:DHA1 family tetracycline resistance protein-like MFS transporter